MKSRKKNIRLTNHAIATARPRASEYILWDSTLNHFGLRVYPSGVRSVRCPDPRARTDAQDHARPVSRHGHRRSPQAGRRATYANLVRRADRARPQTQGAPVPELRGPIPRAAQGPLETVPRWRRSTSTSATG